MFNSKRMVDITFLNAGFVGLKFNHPRTKCQQLKLCRWAKYVCKHLVNNIGNIMPRLILWMTLIPGRSFFDGTLGDKVIFWAWRLKQLTIKEDKYRRNVYIDALVMYREVMYWIPCSFRNSIQPFYSVENYLLNVFR